MVIWHKTGTHVLSTNTIMFGESMWLYKGFPQDKNHWHSLINHDTTMWCSNKWPSEWVKTNSDTPYMMLVLEVFIHLLIECKGQALRQRPWKEERRFCCSCCCGQVSFYTSVSSVIIKGVNMVNIHIGILNMFDILYHMACTILYIIYVYTAPSISFFKWIDLMFQNFWSLLFRWSIGWHTNVIFKRPRFLFSPPFQSHIW